MLYTKPIEQIEWSDIEQFCQQKTKEGAYLDYKREFPAQLEKTIAAMANTLGGVIIIGVAEDSKSTPVLPLVGIPFERGLEERITGIILSNMVPPVFPEMQVVRDESGEKAVIVVRIPQSNQTPHAIARNTKVYLRTGNVNNPEELATIDEMEWLRDKRSKSEDLRQKLYSRACDRFLTLGTLHLVGQRSITVDLVDSPGWLTVCCCPLYPEKPLRTPPEMQELLEQSRTRAGYGPFEYFPSKKHFREQRVVGDGIVHMINTEDRFFYVELSCFGMYYFRQNLQAESYGSSPAATISFRAGEVLARLAQFTDSAARLYCEMGHWPFVQLEMRLEGTKPHALRMDWPDHVAPPSVVCPDDEIHFSTCLMARQLLTERRSLVLDTFERVMWAFGWSLGRDSLGQYYDQWTKTWDTQTR